MSLLQMSFTSAVIILLIIIIRAICINKMPKGMFLTLWAIALIRLMIPFSLPSDWSIYSLVRTNEEFAEKLDNTFSTLPIQENTAAKEIIGGTAPTEIASTPKSEIETTSIWKVMWAAGTIISLLFFCLTYYRCRREFQMSLPVTSDLLEAWMKKHKLKRRMQIRQTDSITAPLTYGIFKPIILIPKNTNWEDTQTLNYMLAHEWIHIRRFDTFLKLVMVLALCFHWFNPLVWSMYILFNRDIELACDERVVKLFGKDAKSVYAMTLINMEEKKNKLAPLCNNFSKNAIEERITAIMKIKKTRILTIIIAVIVVVGISVIFLTSAQNKQQDSLNSDISVASEGVLNEKDYELLKKFNFENMENMTIKEYREKIKKLLNSDEYRKVYEKVLQSGSLMHLKDKNEKAEILYYNVDRLTRGGWESTVYNQEIELSLEKGQSIIFSYKLILDILKEDTLTVGEYNSARETVNNELLQFLIDKKDELKDREFIRKEILPKTESLMSAQSTDNLKVSIVEVSIPPLDEMGIPQFAYGSQEDYISLLTLKAENYENMLLSDFNEKVLDWCNEDYYRMERIAVETARRGDYKAELTEEEAAFVEYTIAFSREENAKMIQSLKTEEKEEDSKYGGESLYKEVNNQAWCQMGYLFSYHIIDKNNITVAERDKALKGMIQDIQRCWNETDIEELLTMSEEEIEELFNNFTEKNSNKKIKIYFDKEDIHFEHMDERKLG